jgi:hypothetical protein
LIEFAYKGRLRFHTNNPKKSIISKALYGTAHLKKPLSSQKKESAPEISQSGATLLLIEGSADVEWDVLPVAKHEKLSHICKRFQFASG